MEPARFDEMRRGCWDIDARIADMDLAGICGVAELPVADRRVLGHGVLRRATTPSSGWRAAGVERLAPRGVGRRRTPIGSSRCSCRGWPTRSSRPTSAPQRRARLQGGELPRAARPVRAAQPAHRRTGIRSWRACEETETVVCLHTGSSSWAPIPRAGHAVRDCITTLFPVNALVARGRLAVVGHTDALPEAERSRSSEGGIGWVPMLADRVDYVLDHSASGSGGRDWTRRPAAERGAAPQLLVLHDRRPVDVRRAATAIGADHILHRERLPARRLDVARHASGRRATARGPVGRRRRARITRANAAELFRHPLPDGGWLATC